MGGTLTAIHTGLQDALTTIPGVLVADHIPEKVVAPMIAVGLDRVDFPLSMAGGSSDWRFVVTVVVKRMETLSAQLLLDEFMSYTGDRSVRQALTADRSLGGACHTLLVESVENVRFVGSDDGQFLAADFAVRVVA